MAYFSSPNHPDKLQGPTQPSVQCEFVVSSLMVKQLGEKLTKHFLIMPTLKNGWNYSSTLPYTPPPPPPPPPLRKIIFFSINIL